MYDRVFFYHYYYGYNCATLKVRILDKHFKYYTQKVSQIVSPIIPCAVYVLFFFLLLISKLLRTTFFGFIDDVYKDIIG